MRSFASDLRAGPALAESTVVKKMRDEAARLGHGFSEHLPYDFYVTAYTGIMYGDTIEATVELESADMHASEVNRGAELSEMIEACKEFPPAWYN